VFDQTPRGGGEPAMTGGAAWVRHSIGMRAKIIPALGKCEPDETTSAECQPWSFIMRTE